ncbi:GDYXXLXY domain-containing protein [Candidatus Omnitrophota bacterium]
MKKRIIIIALVLIQLAVPAWMIVAQEHILKNGDLVKFKTAPVDPYDIFRGRYVALSTDQRSIRVKNVKDFRSGQDLYVIFETDAEGFAQAVDVRLQRPHHNQYIKTSVQYASGDLVHFNLPLNRYYMNEENAPLAQGIYRDNSRQNKQDAFMKVRVLNGKALIEGLYVGGKRLESFFEEESGL